MRSLMHWVTEVDWIWKAMGNKWGVLSVDVHMHPCILKRSLWLQGGKQTESWKGLEAGSQWRSYWSGSCKKYLGLEHRSQVRWRAGRVRPMMRTAHTEISIPTGAQWDNQSVESWLPNITASTRVHQSWVYCLLHWERATCQSSAGLQRKVKSNFWNVKFDWSQVFQRMTS